MKLTKKSFRGPKNKKNEDNGLDDSVIEEEHTVTNGTGMDVGKKRKVSSKVDFNRKKFKPSRLTKQPTSEELNRLRETENLFSSNFFRLQIEEVLKEITVNPKYIKNFEKWLSNFNDFCETLEDGDNYEISNQSWLSKLNVEIPVIQKPLITKGFYKFEKCGPAIIIGSQSFNCNLGPSLNIDLLVKLPKSMFCKDDYLNERYHRKRALYLAQLASILQKSGLIEDVKYKLMNESNAKPLLSFTPVCKSGKHINVTLHVCVEEGIFKLSRFSPSRNNVREDWRFKNADENSLTSPTPIYNNTILIDLTYDMNNALLNETISKCENIKQGIILLKIWLKQRRMYAFTGFIMTMFVVHLMKIKRINDAMSSYQVIRNVWSALAASEWDKQGISLCTSEQTNQCPVLEEFHAHFSVVFIDVSGFNNLCSHVNLETYNALKHESQLAVNFLDNQNINSFQSLFMTPVDLFLKYDHILRIEITAKLKSMVLENVDEKTKLDYGSDTFPLVQKYICDLLRMGLKERVFLITPKCLSSDELSWPISAKLKKANPLKNPLVFGLKLDPDHAFNAVDKGPEANLPEAERFREFWGSKSELRRFQDGTISEACVWETTATIAAKRLIVKKIIFYLMQVKLGIDEKMFYIADQFEIFLHNHRFQPANFDFGTGEEPVSKVGSALNELSKNLRSLTDMPLEITSVQGTSSVFSYTDPTPPLAYAPLNTERFTFAGKYRLMSTEVKGIPGKRIRRTKLYCSLFTPALKVIIHMTHSGKWPEDLEALKCLKTAFYIQIAEALRHQCSLTVYPNRDFIDVLKEGFIFRLEISHQKEISLMMKTVDKEGVTKYRHTDESLDVEYKLMTLPRIRVALNGLYHQHQCFGPAACLVKRWIRSQLIDDYHFPDICIDMLVASVFTNPEPYEVPIQPQVGLWRVIKLLASADWNTHMILLNFNNDLEKEEIVEIETNFSTSRTTLPALYIVTPYENKKISSYSRSAPTFKILARLQILAIEALEVISNSTFELSNNVLALFTPNMEGYDVIIRLKNNLNPLRHWTTQKSLTNIVPEKMKLYEKTDNEFMPVLDFNPVQIYLDNLRSSYSEFALFFHDTYGGSEIGVLWNPFAMESKEFKTSHINGRKPLSSNGKNGIVTDINSILEGFHLLGEGIVDDIQNITNLSL